MSGYEGTAQHVTLGNGELAMSKNTLWRYAIVWEFRVRPGSESQFEKVYGSEGEWSRLFRLGQGYVGTELMRDQNNHRRYLTVDFWRSREDYDAFRQQQAEQYRRMDQKCEYMTEHEMELGGFASIRPAP
jgi:heme-degrading monooxygenase HmoA